ncbi:multidrug transporter [Thermotoga sp. SG1]|uniref:multidrug transporter n=1 Tax=Thermotoga sp. SG1 TaxID=126739 RepID=UPI001E5AB056|nr:multidrug transporter [Thermotoga sp. SG1]
MKKASITAGTTLIGLGVGFILFKYSVFYFIASLLIGIGIGLLIEYLLERKIGIVQMFSGLYTSTALPYVT